MPPYSPYFHVLYDQPEPIGNIGRGTHYSVLRVPCWHGLDLCPLPRGKVQDFAVIWDEDHDCRVMEVIERIYFAGLLSPIVFVGERKGALSIIASPGPVGLAALAKKFEPFMDLHSGDSWALDITTWDDPGSIIGDYDKRTETYLSGIVALWNLGSRVMCLGVRTVFIVHYASAMYVAGSGRACFPARLSRQFAGGNRVRFTRKATPRNIMNDDKNWYADSGP